MKTNTKTKRYCTKKIRAKQQKLKSLLMLIVIMLSAGAIGMAGNITAYDTATINWRARRVLPVNEDRANLSVEERIREIAKERGFQWTDYLVRLSLLESSLNPQAVNVNTTGSIDRGLFQINDYYWKDVSDKCAFDIECSTNWAITKINEGKQTIWVTNELAKQR